MHTVLPDLIAPSAVGGSYTTYWSLQSPGGSEFGAGPAKNIYLSSNFRVDSQFIVTQNFGSLQCSDDYGYFTCGLNQTDGSRGSVYYDATPMLESGRLVDSYDIAKYKFAPGGTFNDFIPAKYTEQRIDHIFVGAGSKVSRYGILLFHYWSGGKLGDTTLSSAPGELKAEMREIHLPSDHYPICAKITFPRKR